MNLITRKQAKEKNLTRYFTGKPCIYGHISQRQTASGRCVTCNNILGKTPEYREKRRIFEQSESQRKKRSIYNKTSQRKESLSQMQKRSYRNNKPAFLMRLLVSRFPSMIRKKMEGCSSSEKLGYTLKEFKDHFESLFLEGMNWDNHGEWHIDHIIPVSKFPVDKIERVNDLSNLQPLWGIDNLKKGDRVSESKFITSSV